MERSKEAILYFILNKLTPNIEEFVKYPGILVMELYQYFNTKKNIVKDPRDYLYVHNSSIITKTFDIVPITDFEGIEGSIDIFSKTIHVLQNLFSGRLVSAHLCILPPDTDTKPFSIPNSKNAKVYIPIILPLSRPSSGVYIEGVGVFHHISGRYISHLVRKKHSMFNYTKSEVYILVIEINCSPKNEDIEDVEKLEDSEEESDEVEDVIIEQ